MLWVRRGKPAGLDGAWYGLNSSLFPLEISVGKISVSNLVGKNPSNKKTYLVK
jgi:hypothetical protein